MRDQNLDAPAPPAGPAMLTSAQVADKLFVSERTLWRMVKARKIPQPLRFSRNLVRWDAAALAACLAAMQG